MSFDDRLRDALRHATESQPLDADDALRRVRTPRTEPAVEPLVVALEEVEVRGRHHLRTRRIVGVAAALVLLAGGVAVPFALRDTPHSTARKTIHRFVPVKQSHKPGNDRVALAAVASALDETTGAGSFRVAYALAETPGTAPTTTTCETINMIRSGAGIESLSSSQGQLIANGPQGAPDVPPGQSPTPATECYSSSTNNDVTTTGTATVNVNPFAMTAVSNVSSFGPVTVQVDDTNYWETPGSGAPTTTGTGMPISGFANLVEGTLGPREGAGAMMGLSSPTGYLSITRSAITDAAKIGTDTVNGEPVTVYRVTVDPSLLASVPGLSPEESKTINAALGVLHDQGFTGNSTDVSIDAKGFVVHTVSTNNFADGGKVVSEDTFSLFGCAGAVSLPDRPVDTTPGTCATGNPPSTTTVASGGVAGPTTTAGTPTTVGKSTVASTTLPPGSDQVITAPPGIDIGSQGPPPGGVSGPTGVATTTLPPGQGS